MDAADVQPHILMLYNKHFTNSATSPSNFHEALHKGELIALDYSQGLYGWLCIQDSSLLVLGVNIEICSPSSEELLPVWKSTPNTDTKKF